MGTSMIRNDVILDDRVCGSSHCQECQKCHISEQVMEEWSNEWSNEHLIDDEEGEV